MEKTSSKKYMEDTYHVSSLNMIHLTSKRPFIIKGMSYDINYINVFCYVNYSYLVGLDDFSIKQYLYRKAMMLKDLYEDRLSNSYKQEIALYDYIRKKSDAYQFKLIVIIQGCYQSSAQQHLYKLIHNTMLQDNLVVFDVAFI